MTKETFLTLPYSVQTVIIEITSAWEKLTPPTSMNQSLINCVQNEKDSIWYTIRYEPHLAMKVIAFLKNLSSITISDNYSKLHTKYGFYIVAFHETSNEEFDHYHVLHDCNWNSRRCNCSRHSFYTRSNRFRRPNRLGNLRREDFAALLYHLSSEGRTILQFGIGQHEWRYPDRFPNLSSGGDPQKDPGPVVASFIDAWQDMCQQEGQSVSTGGAVMQESAGTSGKTTRLQIEKIRLRK